MAALLNRADHYICALWFVSSSLFFFSSPNIGGRRLDVYHTWCGPSANLECRSEMCCTRLAGNAGPKKSPKIRHLGTIAQLCRTISSQLRHTIDNRKNLLNSSVSPTCSHNIVNFGALTAEICWRVWGTLANFNGFRVLTALLHGIVGVSQTLRRWTEGATYIRQGCHHVGHDPHF